MHGSIWSHRLCYNNSWSGVLQLLPSQGRPRIPMLCLTKKCQRNRNNDPYWCYDLPLLTSQVGADVCISLCPLYLSSTVLPLCPRFPHSSRIRYTPKTLSPTPSLADLTACVRFSVFGMWTFLILCFFRSLWKSIDRGSYLRTQVRYKPNVFHVTSTTCFIHQK